MRKIINQFIVMTTLFAPNIGAASDALITAVKEGDLTSVQAEIAAGADVNFRSDCSSLDVGTDCTAIMFAAARGFETVASALIDAGADLEATSSEGHRALSHAALSSDPNVSTINLLVNAGAETEHRSGEWVMTPLQLAIWKHRTEKAVALMALGVDLKAPDKVGDTALNSAIFQRKEDIMRALLEHGADPAWQNNNGQNAFEFADNWDRDFFAHPILTEYHPEFCASNPCEIKKFVFKPNNSNN